MAFDREALLAKIKNQVTQGAAAVPAAAQAPAAVQAPAAAPLDLKAKLAALAAARGLPVAPGFPPQFAVDPVQALPNPETVKVPQPQDSGVPGVGMPIAVLYIDCFPINEEITEASGIIGSANGTVCREFGVAHYKFLDFGKGPGALQVAISDFLEGCQGLHVVAQGSDYDALPALRAAAARVVQGTR